MSMVVEGVGTARAVHERAARMGLDMPITEAVYRVLYEGKAPAWAVADLMLRELKGERWPS
jgi:glycerol-3-phosphate dehydrogenase (NAD(P)+)